MFSNMYTMNADGKMVYDAEKFEAYKKTRRYMITSKPCMDCFSAHTTKNPFEDGTDIKDFVEVHYDEVPDKFLQNVDLAKPSNLYKYLLIKIQKLIAEKPSLKKGIKELLKTYKTFMPKDVSFTEIERGRFNAAIATIKLVEMVLCESRLHSNRQPCSCHGITPEIDADKIDLRKLKSICSSLLDICQKRARY